MAENLVTPDLCYKEYVCCSNTVQRKWGIIIGIVYTMDVVVAVFLFNMFIAALWHCYLNVFRFDYTGINDLVLALVIVYCHWE